MLFGAGVEAFMVCQSCCEMCCVRLVCGVVSMCAV